MSRFGKKKQPTYRIIVSDSLKDPWGTYLENLGYYNPKTKEKNFKADRIKHWLSKGAQLSATLHNLFIDEKIIEAEKIKASKSKKKKKEGIETDLPAEALAKAGEKKAEEIKKATPAEKPKDLPAEASIEAGEKPAEAQAPKEEAKSEEAKPKEPKEEKPS